MKSGMFVRDIIYQAFRLRKRTVYICLLISIAILWMSWMQNNYQRTGTDDFPDSVELTKNLPSHQQQKDISDNHGHVDIRISDMKMSDNRAPNINNAHEDLTKLLLPKKPRGNIIWTGGNGTFIDRLELFNKRLSVEREAILTHRTNLSKWRDIVVPARDVIWGKNEDTIHQLTNNTDILTIAMEWIDMSEEVNSEKWDSRVDKGNVLVQDYFEWTGSERLCRWVSTKGVTKAHWDAAYQRRCNTDPSLSFKPKSLEYIYFHAKPINPNYYWPLGTGEAYPDEYYNTVPSYVFFIHIAQDAVVTSTGDIFSGPTKVLHYTCGHDINPNPPETYNQLPIYSEIFIISGFWAGEFFHKMVEAIPRIVAFIDFLLANPDIKIHVSELAGSTEKILKILGIKSERLIGGVCRAKIVYMPRGSFCGFGDVHLLQLASKLYRDYIKTTYPNQERNSLVMIRRSGSRKFVDYREKEFMVKELATSRGLRFELFPDDPVMSLENAMQMFSRALIIVAPHGAGLANMMFSDPPTLVIEGVCNPPHVNMCFQRVAHVLGHRYHGLGSLGGYVAKEGGCPSVVDILSTSLEETVAVYLQYMKTWNSL